MARFEIRSYDPQDIDPSRANWKVDGVEGNWQALVDPKYGRKDHVVVVIDGIPRFDKVNEVSNGGVYIVPTRRNPEGKIEFQIPHERRPLLRDKEGKQGDVWIRNIPQGLIEPGETPHKAAKRELESETGYQGGDLVYLGPVAFVPSNSESVFHFFMAHIPYEQEAGLQQLEASEEITLKPWVTLAELRRERIIDGSTHIGLDLATQVIKQDLL